LPPCTTLLLASPKARERAEGEKAAGKRV
jgi:hypothetical protein